MIESPRQSGFSAGILWWSIPVDAEGGIVTLYHRRVVPASEAAKRAPSGMAYAPQSHPHLHFAMTLLLLLLTLSITPANSSARASQQSKLGQQVEQELRKANEQSRQPRAPTSARRTSRHAAARATTTQEAAPRRRHSTTTAAAPGKSHRSSARGSDLSTTSQIEFTFAGNVPNTDVFLNKRKVGTTDRDGKLMTRIPSGLHTATMRRDGYFTLTRQVQVQPEQNTFSFKLTPLRGDSGANDELFRILDGLPNVQSESPIGRQVRASDADVPAPQDSFASISAPPVVVMSPPKPALSVADATVASAKIAASAGDEVMGRFLDPKRTDSVTLDDWQQVLAQAEALLLAARNDSNAEAKARQLFAQGQIAFLQRDYGAALAAFRNIIQLMPDATLGHYGMGNVYLATKLFTEALRSYNRAVQLDPKFAMAHRGIADVHNNQNRSQQALVHYERARELGYDTPSTALSMGRILLDRGRWAEALEHLNKIPAGGQNADVMILIGDAHNKLKRPEDARAAYNRATELNGKSAIGFYKLGEMLFRQQQYREALEPLERALVLDSTGGIIDRERVRRMVDEAGRKAR